MNEDEDRNEKEKEKEEQDGDRRKPGPVWLMDASSPPALRVGEEGNATKQRLVATSRQLWEAERRTSSRSGKPKSRLSLSFSRF